MFDVLGKLLTVLIIADKDCDHLALAVWVAM